MLRDQGTSRFASRAGLPDRQEPPFAAAAITFPRDRRIISQITPRDWSGLTKPWITAMVRCGENSLTIYCLGVLLSFAGHVLLIRFSDSIAMQVFVNLAGIGLLIAAATIATQTSKLDHRGPSLF